MFGGSIARIVQEHVGVEVTPAELSAQGVGAGVLRQSALDLTWRYAAEVQVGGELRGSGSTERVVAVGVVADRIREEALHPLTCRVLSRSPPRSLR
jgi:hypothetical protein